MLSCGPAYNSNAVREFLFKSGFLDPLSPDSISLHLAAMNAFQAVDIISNVGVGFILDGIGPRWTHIMGHVFFCIGIIFMKWRGLLYLGFILQGFASGLVLTSVLHLANLFPRRSKFALNAMTSLCDVSAFAFPLLNLILDKGLLTGEGCITALCVCAVFAIAVTSQACPDEPFELEELVPANDIMQENMHVKPDRRDEWGDETARLVRETDEETVNPLYTGGDATPTKNRRRMSNISSSLQGYRASSESNVVVVSSKREPWYIPLMSWRWVLVTLYTAFACCRQNLYITANAELLTLVGDTDGQMAKYYELILPFCFVSGLIIGGLMEVTGVIMGMFILNTCGILTSYLSVVPNLKLQWLTFLFSIINRASTFGAMLTYMTEITDVHNFPIISGMTLVVAGGSLILINGAIQHLALHYGPQTWKTVQHCFGHLGFLFFICLYLMHKLDRRSGPIGKGVVGAVV